MQSWLTPTNLQAVPEGGEQPVDAAPQINEYDAIYNAINFGGGEDEPSQEARQLMC